VFLVFSVFPLGLFFGFLVGEGSGGVPGSGLFSCLTSAFFDVKEDALGLTEAFPPPKTKFFCPSSGRSYDAAQSSLLTPDDIWLPKSGSPEVKCAVAAPRASTSLLSILFSPRRRRKMPTLQKGVECDPIPSLEGKLTGSS